MFWGVDGLMCCDASVIPHHISANPNATIMALANRASEYVITQILGKAIDPRNHVTVNPESAEEMHDHEAAVKA